MGPAAATTRLAAGLAENGPLQDVFHEAVSRALGADLASTTGTADSTLAELAVFRSQLDTRFQALQTRVGELEQIDVQLDAAFPWGKTERETDPAEWAAGWRRIGVDSDWLSNAAENMQDPSVANSTAAIMANPNRPGAERQKQAVALKSAPKKGWKNLCLAPFGGSPELLHNFLSTKATGGDKTIKAQRLEMMPAIFAGIKSMKRRAKKASARKPLEIAFMQRDFYLDWQLSLTHLAATPFAFTTGPDQATQFPAKRLWTDSGDPAPSRLPSGFPGGGAPTQGANSLPPAPPAPVQVPVPQQTRLAGGSARGGDKKATAGAILNDLNNMVGRQQPAAIEAYVGQKFRSTPAEVAGIRSVLSNYCHHCILNSRRVVKHSRGQCRAEGGKPSSPCARCGSRGIMAYCWPEDCPGARCASQ
ncbi:unnamed protein product [Prorocentrum cordatum]|uniref:Uncharacterized protein n=1 Tax=Prorocentrum cordatum TaxID=2364126 RepID=A0ABN9SXW8_9DINO|nr:unnamed protein product [Polarella glacialis]